MNRLKGTKGTRSTNRFNKKDAIDEIKRLNGEIGRLRGEAMLAASHIAALERIERAINLYKESTSDGEIHNILTNCLNGIGPDGAKA